MEVESSILLETSPNNVSMVHLYDEEHIVEIQAR